MMKTAISRRVLLKSGLAAGAGLVIGFDLPLRNGARAFAQAGVFKPSQWLRIDRDGVVTITNSVPEMGHAVRIEGTPPRFAQEGQAVYRWATQRLPALAREACERAGLRPEDLAGVVLHQANLRIVEPLAEKIGAVNPVVARDVVDSGNTSAASIPLGMSKWWRAGRIPGDKLALLFGFGGGFAYAGTVIRTPALPA